MQRQVNSPKRNYRRSSFPNSGSGNTLAALVELQQKIEIGRRIKWLRDNSAETSRTIAEYCKVSNEAVRNWIAGKGILWDNAELVAKMFVVDVDWVWRGTGQAPEGYQAEDTKRRKTPDPFATGPYAERLRRIEEKLDEILKRLSPAEDGGERGQRGAEPPDPTLPLDVPDEDEEPSQAEDQQRSA